MVKDSGKANKKKRERERRRGKQRTLQSLLVGDTEKRTLHEKLGPT